MFEDACREFALQIYQDLIHAAKGKYIIDKSPRYYCILEFIDKLFPQSRRIMLTRNPLDIASSYKKIYNNERDRFDLARMLAAPDMDMRIIDLTLGQLRYLDYFAEDHELAYRVSYERLVTQPQEQLAGICEFLNLPFEEGMERYGEFMDQGQADLFFSMGVGDPLLPQHREPHAQSVHRWHEVLEVQEIEALCRVFGADVFQRLGYADQLEQAEQLTGVKFDPHPDHEFMELRRQQLKSAIGFDWELDYRLNSQSGSGLIVNSDDGKQILQAGSNTNNDVQRLQIMLNTLHTRLDDIYQERDRYKRQYEMLRRKVDRITSWIPYSNRFTKWANSLWSEGGKRS